MMMLSSTNRRWPGLLCVAAALLGGCTSGPDYRPPSTAVADTWQATAPAGLVYEAQGQASLQGWWQQFGDPALDSLMEQALAHNPDLQIAQSRLQQARLARDISSAERLPRLDAGLSAQRQDTRDNTSRLYGASLDASWEPDLAGGQRRALESATAELQASEAELGDVQVSLLAEVALAYVELRVYQARIATLQASLANQQDSFDLARWRNQAGLATELDVEQARYALEQSRAQLPVLETAQTQSLNRLSVLTGAAPGNLAGLASHAGKIPALPAQLTASVPADALRQRPDIRRAERLLAARSADIGIARAALYPALSLRGSLGSQTSRSADLFDPASRLAALTGALTQPLFNGERLRNTVRVQEELYHQAQLTWHNAVLVALEETEAALLTLGGEQRHREALQRAVSAATNANELATRQYESGLVDFQTVLNTQQARLNLEAELLQTEGSLAAGLIRLYKAMGGGWAPPSGEGVDTHE